MQGVRGEGPEVPGHVWVSQVSLGVPLLTVDEVRELDRVLNEEYGSVVSNHVVVSFFSVELQREPSRVSVGVSRAELTSYS